MDDPLIYHGALKAKWGSEALSAIKDIREKVSEIVLPLLIYHGCDDHLVPLSASEFVFAAVSSSNKTFEVITMKCVCFRPGDLCWDQSPFVLNRRLVCQALISNLFLGLL